MAEEVTLHSTAATTVAEVEKEVGVQQLVGFFEIDGPESLDRSFD